MLLTSKEVVLKWENFDCGETLDNTQRHFWLSCVAEVWVDTDKYPKSTTQNYLAPVVHSAEVEKPEKMWKGGFLGTQGYRSGQRMLISVTQEARSGFKHERRHSEWR